MLPLPLLGGEGAGEGEGGEAVCPRGVERGGEGWEEEELGDEAGGDEGERVHRRFN